MSKIGFIGTGNMGGPMAVNLVKAGHDVTAFDLSPALLAPVTEAGGRIEPQEVLLADEAHRGHPRKGGGDGAQIGLQEPGPHARAPFLLRHAHGVDAQRPPPRVVPGHALVRQPVGSRLGPAHETHYP